MGYWNDFVPFVDYATLDSYVDSIDHYVNSGMLKSASEFYYPVRLKPKGDNTLEQLKRGGVNHIEIRMIDLNPFSFCGIMEEDLEFLHLLFVYLSSLEDEEFDDEAQVRAITNMKRAALFDEEDIKILGEHGQEIPVSVAVKQIFEDMEAFYQKCGKMEAVEKLKFQKDKVEDEKKRYANQIVDRFQTDYVQKGINLAKSYVKALK